MGIEDPQTRTPAQQTVVDTIWQYWQAFARGDMRWKFEVMDVDEELHQLAAAYLKDYEGDFEYLVDLKAKTGMNHMSLSQAKGVLNTAVAGVKREKGLIGKRRTVKAMPDDGFFGTLQDEMYFRIAGWAKAEAGTKVLSILTEVKPKMKWQGVAAVRPDLSYSVWGDYRDTEIEERVKELLADDADLAAMQVAFAKALNRCSTCGKTLTSPLDTNGGKCPKHGSAAAPTSPEPPVPNGAQGVRLEEVEVPF